MAQIKVILPIKIMVKMVFFHYLCVNSNVFEIILGAVSFIFKFKGHNNWFFCEYLLKGFFSVKVRLDKFSEKNGLDDFVFFFFLKNRIL